MRKYLIILMLLLCWISGAIGVSADTQARDAQPMTIDTGQNMFLTLEEDWDWRWNVNGPAGFQSVVHLDGTGGSNCNFQMEYAGDGYYGIKYGSYYLDIEKKAESVGNVMHLYHTDLSNDNQKFAFYDAGTDQYGNQKCYIQVKASGYWLGIEGNSPGEHKKIMQVEEGSRKAWILTPCTYPKKEKTTALPGGTVAEIFEPSDEMPKSVNVKDDNYSNGADLNLFSLGSSCKMKLKWNASFQAYIIEAANNYSGESTGKVWDVEGGNGQSGTVIHLWSEQDKSKNQNTSQFWQLVKDGEKYYIKNLRSGLYANTDSGGKLKLSKQPKAFIIDMIDDLDQADPWMADIPDEALLSSLSIPGTHDTGTANIVQGGIPQISMTTCQKYYISEQLNVGIRAFDIRGAANSGATTPGDVRLVHGSETWMCKDKDGKDLTLQQVLDDSVTFLRKYPSETILMTIKPDSGTHEDLARALGYFMKHNSQYVWQSDQIPTMKEARGKIVFVSRFDMGNYDPAKDGIDVSWFGPNLSKWDDFDYAAQTGAISIYEKGSTRIYVQDAYKKEPAEKLKYIQETMKQTTENTIPKDAYVYNYTSTAGGSLSALFPLQSTRDINPTLYQNSRIGSGKLGIVMVNFADRPLAKKIYQANNKDSVYAARVDFPDKIQITYGDRLKEARLNKTSSNGTFVFENPDYIPTRKDVESQRTFKLFFRSKDGRLEETSKDVKITSFSPREITVTIDDKTVDYGQQVPTLTYQADADQLADGDTLEDLGITLSTSAEKSRPGAGTYPITAEYKSDHYRIRFENQDAELKVKKRRLEIQWSDTENLVYTGKPILVTAAFTNLLPGDLCEPVIFGGNAAGPSWNAESPDEPKLFRAEITDIKGAQAGNYQLPEEGLVKEYYIERALPSGYTYPEEIHMTYGQSLGEAEMVGASGPGTFFFEEKGVNIMDQIPKNAGSYIYDLVFKPDDPALLSVKKPVTVKIEPKTIRAEALDVVKTRGEKTQLDFVLLDKLVGEDKKEELKVILTAGEGDRDDCEAGAYWIWMSEWGNSNYRVEMTKASLSVLDDPALQIELAGLEKNPYYGDSFYVKAQGGLAYSGPIRYKADGAAIVDADSGRVTITGTGKYRVWAEKSISQENQKDFLQTPVRTGTGQKRELEVKWKSAGDLVYTGQQAQITAHVYGMVKGDGVTAQVQGGDQVNAGKYMAKIVLEGEKSDFYKLPENYKYLYTIEKAPSPPLKISVEPGQIHYGEIITAAIDGIPEEEKQAGVTWFLTDEAGRLVPARITAYGGKGQNAIIEPQQAGSFLVKATLSGMENYQDAAATAKQQVSVLLQQQVSAPAPKAQTKPAAPKLKLKKSKGRITVTWSKVSGATKYQVYRAPSSKGKYKKRKDTSATKFVDKKVTKKKKYKYKVRAYKVTDGKKIYGSFSKVKKIKAK